MPFTIPPWFLAAWNTSSVKVSIERYQDQLITASPWRSSDMGRTQLSMEVIDEYIQSLESIYTRESYDLFVHNCNNFSQDLCTFLVGKSIPDKISTLPETFLKTPIGQMMRGQIDQSMRKMTLAPDAVSGQNARLTQSSPTQANGLSRMQTQTNGSHPTRPNLHQQLTRSKRIAY